MLKEPKTPIKATRSKTFNGKRYQLWGIEASEASARKVATRLRKAPAVRVIRFNRVSWGIYYWD